eukprot:scaffold167_cov347-Prasinococcus_capsulatus_cf.AAC.6
MGLWGRVLGKVHTVARMRTALSFRSYESGVTIHRYPFFALRAAIIENSTSGLQPRRTPAGGKQVVAVPQLGVQLPLQRLVHLLQVDVKPRLLPLRLEELRVEAVGRVELLLRHLQTPDDHDLRSEPE